MCTINKLHSAISRLHLIALMAPFFPSWLRWGNMLEGTYFFIIPFNWFDKSSYIWQLFIALTKFLIFKQDLLCVYMPDLKILGKKSYYCLWLRQSITNILIFHLLCLQAALLCVLFFVSPPKSTHFRKELAKAPPSTCTVPSKMVFWTVFEQFIAKIIFLKCCSNPVNLTLIWQRTI